jgi:glycosyltransferase involved in cell wall biosynthesis
VTAVYNALDIITSSSAFGEGFSNTIGEGMACERVPVATDVGDAEWIIGDTGIVVPPRDDVALKNAWAHLLEQPKETRRQAGQRARSRIVSEFSAEALARRTEAALARLPSVLSPAAVF